MSLLQKLNPTYVTEHALKTFKRFPLVILCAIFSGFVADHAFVSKKDENIWLMEGIIGISLFMALNLFFERQKNLRAYFVGIVLCFGFLIGLHYANPFDYESSYMRLFQISVSLHVLVAIAPFLHHHERNAFWHFNERLFLRFCLSSVYTGVLFLGSMAIVYSLKGLFDLEVSNDSIRHIALMCFFGFHPIHFLAGVPSDYDELNQSTDYPNMLRIFCKYLLCSLVTVYGLILIAYGLKIVIVGEWPKGLVCSLIGCYSIAGLYTYLMIHPLIEGETWAKIFGKAFLGSLIPLSVLMLAAIYRRYWEYGLTESRYIIILYALWLFGISAYLLISKNKNIRLVPLSLFIACFGTAFGPWGAYSLSLRYQQNKLEKLLAEQKIFSDGKVTPSKQQLADSIQQEITSVVKYILKRHGTGSFRGWFGETKTAAETDGFMRQLGLRAVHDWKNRSNSQYCTFTGKELELAKNETKALAIQARYADSASSSGWHVSIVDKEVVIKFKEEVLYKAKAAKFLADIGHNRDLCHQDAKNLQFNRNGLPVRLGIGRVQANISDNEESTYISELVGVILY